MQKSHERWKPTHQTNIDDPYDYLSDLLGKWHTEKLRECTRMMMEDMKMFSFQNQRPKENDRERDGFF